MITFCVVSDVLAFSLVYSYSRIFVFQAEDGIRDLVRSRGLGDVYKRQHGHSSGADRHTGAHPIGIR